MKYIEERCENWNVEECLSYLEHVRMNDLIGKLGEKIEKRVEEEYEKT